MKHPTRDEMWDTDAEDMHTLLKWLTDVCRDRSDIHFYETLETGVRVVHGKEGEAEQVMITYDKLEDMHRVKSLSLIQWIDSVCGQCDKEIQVGRDPDRGDKPYFCTADCQGLYEAAHPLKPDVFLVIVTIDVPKFEQHDEQSISLFVENKLYQHTGCKVEVTGAKKLPV